MTDTASPGIPTSSVASPQPRQDIEAILHPRSIAVVGASTNPKKQGYIFVQLLKEFGFKGGIYPVNPKASEIAGLKCYSSIKEVPRPLDYIISAVPAPLVPQLMAEAQGMGVKAVHLFTGRLAEMGTDEGIRMQREAVAAAREGGMRVIGPNCMGVYNPGHGISFRLNFPKRSGPVAFLSQSGGNAIEFVYRASLRGVFFSKAISYGNASDLDESDFLEYFTSDPETRIIVCYIEGVKDGRRFLRVLSEAARAKPVIVLKGGRTKAGARAVASHTASLAGSDQIWESLIKQAGAIRAGGMEEMADMVVAFRYMEPPRGLRVGVISGGGGGTVHSADICEAAGLHLPPLPDEVRHRFKAHLPDTWYAASNPFDLSAIVSASGGELTIPLAAQFMAESDAFDVVIVDPDLEFQFESPDNQDQARALVENLIRVKQSSKKPMAMIIRPGDVPEAWRWRTTMELQRKAWEAGFPIYPTMGRAARSIYSLIRHHQDR
ncbi:MAG: CoA-binding protein [Chloroflexi bacterium]|nr:CoA-binding protein [Chloroflexota bacterium]